VVAHPLYLFQDSGSPRVELFAPEKPTPGQWLALLYTNQQALSQIDAQLKAITSLGKTMVKFYDGNASPEVVELMQHFG
jgi:hypothetical protein